MRIEDGLVAEIVAFDSYAFEWFGLPPQLEPR